MSFVQYGCETCDRVFSTIPARIQHMNALNHWAPLYECEKCDRQFATVRAQEQHMDAVDHWAPRYGCDACDDRFLNEDERDEHMTQYGHQRWKCEKCDRQFGSVKAQEQHMDAVGHWAHYCSPCQRKFDNDNSLHMVHPYPNYYELCPQLTITPQHQHSRFHHGESITCPYCGRAYTNATGVSHHLERGSCQGAAVDRESIYSNLYANDPYGQYTNTLRNGPITTQLLYHCLNGNCGREFKSVAAFFNHLESETCGYMKYEDVQRNAKTFQWGGTAADCVAAWC